MNQTDWYIFFLSAFPVTELRVTIPLALGLGMGALRVFVLAVLGNLLPIIPVILLLEPLSKMLRYFPRIDGMFQRLLAKSRRKGKQVEKYGAVGLMLFVAVPLPGTGAWTGAILAWLFGLNIIYSTAAIGLGVVIAGVLVTSASVGILKAALVYDLEYILAILLLCIGLYLILRFLRRSKKR